ncbi:MAG: 3-deoxy-8-phosphooctulonate synthase [Actinomycetota bacterium]
MPVRVTEDVTIGDHRLGLLGGPCVLESVDHAVQVGGEIRDICADMAMPYIFKASFDKANRSSSASFRGLGLDAGLAALAAVRRQLGVPVMTDVHETMQVEPAAAVCDVLQIPAFLCRQTDLLVAAAASGAVVNVKKGQFLSPGEMINVVDKVRGAGASDRVLVTERGTTFGYNNLVVDFRSLPLLRGFGAPVVFDATHSVQQPGALGASTGGDRRFAPYLARAAVAVGVDAIFMEIHDDPDVAPSDGPNMIRLADVPGLLASLRLLHDTLPRLPAIG